MRNIYNVEISLIIVNSIYIVIKCAGFRYSFTNLSYAVVYAYFASSTVATGSVIWTLEKFILAAHHLYVVIWTALATLCRLSR